VVVMLVVGASAVVADTLQVPSADYPTIQSAIDAAVDGDTVQVAAGTYLENLLWQAKSIALIGAGPEVTKVGGSGASSCLTLVNVPGTARVEGFTFTGGLAEHGGGLRLEASSLTVANNTVTGNASSSRAGGVYLYNSPATLTNNTITSNTARYGGGLYVNGSEAALTSNTISNNTAERYGGGVHFRTCSATATGNTIAANSCGERGGGVYMYEATATMHGNTIADNSSDYYGGGVYLRLSPATVANNSITRNEAWNSGGGLYLFRSSARIDGNDISDNTTEYGGGMSTYRSSPTVTRNNFTGNTANTGGALYLREYSSPTLESNSFVLNRALYASAIEIANAAPTLLNNVITSNIANIDAAVRLRSLASPKFINNTIARNEGGGLRNSAGATSPAGTPVITNCILWGNYSYDLTGDPVTITYSDIGTALVAGTGNISLDPKFEYSGWNPDCHLRSISPCVNAGDSSVSGLPATDRDGNPRIVGEAVDMGAYECQGPPNRAPVAADDCYSADEDAALTVPAPGVLGNDSDPDGDPISAVLTGDVSNGTLTLNADGSLEYTPDPDFNGADSFTYAANDGEDDSNVATVTITIAPLNDAPLAEDDAYSVDEDNTLTVPAPGVLDNDSDADGDALTASPVTRPSNGALTLNADGSFEYTPDPDFNGADSFTYKANDGVADSNEATVTITVNPVNDAPVAVDDAYSTDEGETLTVDPPGVLANDSDPDGDPLTAILMESPSQGMVTFNPVGSFTYEPASSFTGTDTFTYVANDSQLNSNVATVTITVTAGNIAPVAVDDAYLVDEDNTLSLPAPGVLGNDSDVNLDPLTAALVTGTSNGTLTLNPDGCFSYTPALNFWGTDSFTYVANDGPLDSNVATVTITVKSVNDPPVAVDDEYTLEHDSTFCDAAPGVLRNDIDPDTAYLIAIKLSLPSHGWAILAENGAVQYTPDPGFYGTDSFIYKANDGHFDSNIATVTLNVTPPDDLTPPEILDLQATPDVLKANHKIVEVTLSCTLVDACDPNPTWCITSVSSNEPESGLGNWDRSPDWQIVGDHVVLLRCEHSPKGDGRIYTITVEAADASGNCSTAMTQVRVPKGGKK